MSSYVVWFCAVLSFVMGSGCGPAAMEKSSLQADVTFTPSPPTVGDVTLSMKLTDASGAPLHGAQVRVEGNMNHAGMKPSFADLKEEEPGRYTGTLKFTMGGDWFLLITAKTAAGTSLEQKVDVPGVKAP